MQQFYKTSDKDLKMFQQLTDINKFWNIDVKMLHNNNLDEKI